MMFQTLFYLMTFRFESKVVNDSASIEFSSISSYLQHYLSNRVDCLTINVVAIAVIIAIALFSQSLWYLAYCLRVNHLVFQVSLNLKTNSVMVFSSIY